MLTFEKKIIKFFEDNKLSYGYDRESHFINSGTRLFKLQAGTNSSEIGKNIDNVSSIVIWQDQYLHKKDIIESRILSKLGKSTRIYARETIAKPISQEELSRFLELNHLNVNVKTKHRYGLFYKQNLVAIAAFGRSCPIQHNGLTYRSHELIRFCNILGHTVVGGLSKLVKHFVKAVNPEHLMTYIDKEWSDGSSYQKMGFEQAGLTAPQTFWLSPSDNRRYYPHELPDKSEKNLVGEGWNKINNRGNIKLVKFLK